MWEKWRKHLTLMISILILIFLVFVTMGSQYNNSIAIFADKVFYTIHTIFEKITDIGANISTTIHDFNHLQQERDRLMMENAELRKLALVNDQLHIENQYLLEAFNYKQERPDYSLIFSRVIKRNPSEWYQSVIIDAGSKDGLSEGMTVIAVEDETIGIVGVVKEVYANTARVHLIVDPYKNIAAASQVRNKPLSDILEEPIDAIWYQGIIEGSAKTQGMLEMIYISHEAEIEIGSPVLSTGLGGYYVPDIPVGTVEDLETDAFGLLQRAIVRPYIDFSRLREVLVIASPLPINLEGEQ